LPRRRYNIFCGTHTWTECREALRQSLFARAPLVDGPSVGAYEQAFARTVGTRFGFSYASGRMALYRILEALDIGPGDEVIIPAFTCVVVANAILYRGAVPIYVDIDPRTFNIDVRKVEAAMTPRTKALLAQHTFGLLCDVDALNALGQRHGIPVIEDASLALGASSRGRPAGGLTRVAFFSTDHSKIISTLSGGMITTDDSELAERLRVLHQRTPFLASHQVRKQVRTFLLECLLFHPNLLWAGRSVEGALALARFWFFFYDSLSITKPTGYPYPARLANALATLGLSQLALLDQNLAHRRAIGTALDALLGWNAGLLEPGSSNHVFLRYSILVRDRAAVVRLFRKRFDLGVWFTSVVSGRDHDLEAVGYRPGSCPVAERVTRHIVNWPTHPRIPPRVLVGAIQDRLPDLQRSMMSPDDLQRVVW